MFQKEFFGAACGKFLVPTHWQHCRLHEKKDPLSPRSNGSGIETSRDTTNERACCGKALDSLKDKVCQLSVESRPALNARAPQSLCRAIRVGAGRLRRSTRVRNSHFSRFSWVLNALRGKPVAPGCFSFPTHPPVGAQLRSGSPLWGSHNLSSGLACFVHAPICQDKAHTNQGIRSHGGKQGESWIPPDSLEDKVCRLSVESRPALNARAPPSLRGMICARAGHPLQERTSRIQPFF